LDAGPVADHLITPQNAALVLIDYQPAQFSGIRSMDPGLLLKNIVSTVKTAKTFGLPIVHSTINVASGRERPAVSQLEEGTWWTQRTATVLESSAPADSDRRWRGPRCAPAALSSSRCRGVASRRPSKDSNGAVRS